MRSAGNITSTVEDSFPCEIPVFMDNRHEHGWDDDLHLGFIQSSSLGLSPVIGDNSIFQFRTIVQIYGIHAYQTERQDEAILCQIIGAYSFSAIGAVQDIR